MTHAAAPLLGMNRIKRCALTFCLALTLTAVPAAERTARDIAAGRPLVIHVSVALADNRYQGIVPVPESIGDGRQPRNNLYWGARYGVKTFLLRDGGWRKLEAPAPDDERILERLVLHKTFVRNGQPLQAYLVADAWDGRYIADTVERFLRHSAGHDHEAVAVADVGTVHAGGSAHMQVYIGHNPLMDATPPAMSIPQRLGDQQTGDAIILACKSRQYFTQYLEAAGSHPLVLTAGLMAPEAYTLDSAISAWATGKNDNDIRKAAAAAYDNYQKTGRRAAEWLFGVER